MNAAQVQHNHQRQPPTTTRRERGGAREATAWEVAENEGIRCGRGSRRGQDMDAHACIQVGRGGACMREELMSWLGPSTIDDLLFPPSIRLLDVLL